MTNEVLDPKDIPILTDAVDQTGRAYGLFDAKAVHAAVVSETLKLADSLLHQAAKDMEAALFERVFDQLREQLPELVDRVLRQNTMNDAAAAAEDGAPASVGAEFRPADTDL